MIIDILIGAVAIWLGLFLVDYTRMTEINVHWWQWALTVGGIIFAIITFEAILGLLEEGLPQGALVIGSLMGIIVVVWGVLLRRFVFKASSIN